MLQRIVFYTALLFMCVNNSNLSAQVLEGELATQKIKNAKKIWLNEQNSSIKYIEFLVPEKIEEKNHSKWLCQLLDCPSNVEFKLIRKIEDQIGQTHYRYAQYMDNYLIEGAQYLVHKRNNQILSINGDLHTAKELVSSASISEGQALSYAKKSVPSNHYLWEAEKAAPPEGTLVLVGKKGIYKLTYKFDIYSLDPLGRYYVFVDANSGEIAQKNSRINNTATPGVAHTKYSGIQSIITDSIGAGMYILKDSIRNIHTRDLNTSQNVSTAVDFTDTDNVWTSTINQDDAALDAHWGAAMTYDYFLNIHGLDSYDGLGSSINSYVHYGVNVYNAYWDGSQMLYGDGDGVNSTALTTLDIVGHEISHGVIQHSANLVYQDEPGALNESFSDIFGVAIDFYANPSIATWYIGDQISMISNGFRNMANPNEMQQPDTYQGTYWYRGVLDNGGVHINSGVQNFWFYLLTQGGTGVNDIGNAYNVTGLGSIDAAKIAYRNLSVYLTSSSEYAEAQFYSIQSARDLFGACSIEERATTNAWHAVGIGDVYVNSVNASFDASTVYSCSTPGTINFNNTSLNDSTSLWYFGDGDSSTLRNPSHTYTAVGTYDVTLIIRGKSLCGGRDTLFLPNYITITNSGAPIPTTCIPLATTGNVDYGVFNYTFNTINNSTGSSLNVYEDYTCSHQTTVTAGDFINLSIDGGVHNTNAAVYIDYNNDGLFSTTEEIYTSYGLNRHIGTVMISDTVTYNVPLRMRVIVGAYSLLDNCMGSGGQSEIEDYTIFIQAISTPPTADFIASPRLMTPGSTVNFSNRSSGLPSSYLWSFPNGIPSSSTAENPVVNYTTLGTHDVQLIVSNAFGSDTVLKSNYISVANIENMCSPVTSTTGTSGILHDSGGRLHYYSDYEDCYFLIQPFCSDSIFLDFVRFRTELVNDYIEIYDGTSTAGRLIYSASGSNLPPRAVATSGAMYIHFHSNDFGVGFFEAHWSSVDPPAIQAFTASFAASTLNPEFGMPISFTDQSTGGSSSWSWDFGDGNTSTVQNPSNRYFASGAHTVELIASNCYFSDTTSMIINVQAAPIIEVSPDSLSVTMNCGDSMNIPIVIRNTGSGPLNYTTSSSYFVAPVNIVAWTYGVDYVEEYANTINAINSHYTNYTLTETNTTDATTLQAYLNTADVLLIAEQEYGSPAILQLMNPIIQNYVTNGGWVILCGNEYRDINALGLFSINTGHVIYNGVHTIVDANSPLLENVTLPISFRIETYYGEFSNPGFNTATNFTYLPPTGDSIIGGSIIGDLDIGQGKAIYIGLDYFQSNPNEDRIIANAIKWAAMHKTAIPWISSSLDSGSVVAGDSILMDVIIDGNLLSSGHYNDQLLLLSNDSINPVFSVPIHLHLIGTPNIAFNKHCILFDSTMQYTTDTAGLWVYNTGCDTLRITNILTSNANVSVDNNNLLIKPYDSTYVNFIFAPDTAQHYLGLITFFSNAGDSTICFDAYSEGAAIIDVNPDSLFVTMACVDSIHVPILLKNTGSEPLHYTTNSSSSTDPIHIVAWTYGVDYGVEYTNTINGLNTYYTDYRLTEINTLSVATLQSYLSTADVLLIAEQEFADPVKLRWMIPTLQDYVTNGGWVIVCGNRYEYINALGLFNIDRGNNAWGGFHTITDANSPLLINTIAPINISRETSYGMFTNLGFNTVTSYLGHSVVGDLDIGQGKAIYIGFDYFQNNSNADRIIANAVEWASMTKIRPWVTTNPNNGTILGGDSILVDVIINGSGMVVGNHSGTFVVQSNDPVNPFLSVPVNLNITGMPNIAVRTNCVSFDSTIQHTSDTAGVWVYNTGCDTLRITNITTSNIDVSSTNSNFIVNPYDSTYVNFTFSPDTAQNYVGLIAFFSNAGDRAICFTGTGIVMPIIDLNPDSILVTINCEDSIVVPLIISNTGTGILTYNDTITDTWLALSSNSGVLPSGNSNTDHLTIYGTGLSNGVYTSNILVYSNDPNTPTRIIPVVLTIERNAILAVSDSCLNLGSVLQNIPAVDSVLISNIGCEVMHINNVNSNFTALVGTVDTFIIPPGQSTWLEVTYTSNVLGAFNRNINVVTLNQVTSICVYGIITVGNDANQVETSDIIAKIYPNPNNGDFTFYYKGDSKSIHLNLYGVNGQLILSKDHQVRESLLVNFTDLNLSEGVYYLEMISDKETKTLELIVTKP